MGRVFMIFCYLANAMTDAVQVRKSSSISNISAHITKLPGR